MEAIRSQIAEPLASNVRFLECMDGIPSPAGPFNAGLAAATADYVGIMGSDDTLDPDSMRQWLAIARANNSAAVLAPQRHASGAKVRTPPVRVGRTSKLDPVKDRLSYRTAPLGLIQTSEIHRLGLKFSNGYKSGEDQEFSARLYFGGGRIDYAKGAGCYVVGADASDRVTSESRPIGEDFRFATDLVTTAWFLNLPERSRSAIVTKLIRVHVFAAAGSRSPADWTAEERLALSTVATTLIEAATAATRPLSIAEARLLAAIVDPGISTLELARRASSRKKFGRPATMIASRPGSQFAVEGPLRFMVSSALL
ncbi:MAG: glycosyltransferase [Specibacter sp.]